MVEEKTNDIQLNSFIADVKKALYTSDYDLTIRIAKNHREHFPDGELDDSVDALIWFVHLIEKLEKSGKAIDERLESLCSTEGVKCSDENRTFLRQRFMYYIALECISIGYNFNTDKKVNQDEIQVEVLKAINDFQAMKKIITSDVSLIDYLKSLTGHGIKKIVHNAFFNTEEQKIRKGVNAFDNLIFFFSEPNESSKDDLIAWFKLVLSRRLTMVGHFLFEGILDDFEVLDMKRSKSLKMRLLFPLFQITHPVRCMDEETWEKIRNKKDIIQNYSSYQVSTIKKIIGVK